MNGAESLSMLAARLGEETLTRRLEAEDLLRNRKKVQGRGLFRFESKCDLYRLIRSCIKISGLWNRAVRNYFDIQVVSREITIEELPPEFDGFTILQLTDLHADLHPDFASRVAEVIRPLRYDLLALTGDYRTCTYSDHSGATAATIQMLSEVQVPIYAVLGNHDSIHKVPVMEAAGIRFLLNEHALIKRGDAQLALIGIDDPNYYKTHDLERAMKGLSESLSKVLLSHSPQTYKEANAHGIDFLMAGHTHGGQICLPGGRVVMHDNSSPRHLLAGQWREGRLQGYTSRGTGASGLPARLNCPAEVTLHTLRRRSH